MSSLSKQSNWVALTITIYNYTSILSMIAFYDYYTFLSLTFGQNVDRSGFAITIWDGCLCVRVGVETFTSSQFYFACWPKQFFHLDSWIYSQFVVWLTSYDNIINLQGIYTIGR